MHAVKHLDQRRVAARIVTPLMLASKIADMIVVPTVLPLRRMGQKKVAAAMVWLASDAASFVVGHILSINGGFLSE
jgi:NAD(P)-dependent dehydrogenase (short-subunit alcohol dehydrogenase family)